MAVTSCTEIRELFSARADEDLTAAEGAQLEAHLATCAECAREWRRFEQTLALVRSIEPARAPAGFVDGVMAARPRPWYRRLARAVLLPWPIKLPLEAAAILVVAGLAVLLVQRSPELHRTAQEPATPPRSVTSEAPVASPPPDSAPAPAATNSAAPTPPVAPPGGPAPADAPAARQGGSAASPPPAPSATSSTSAAAPGPPREQEVQKRTFDSLDAERRDLRDAAASKAAPPSGASVPTPPPASGALAQGGAAERDRAKSEALAKERSENIARPDGPGASAPPSVPTPLALSRRSAPHPNQVALANLANIQARLTTTDREASERAVREIVTRVSGQVLLRSDVDGGVLMSLRVPGPRWEEVKTQLQALGPLQLETVGDAGADPLRIQLRLQR